MRVQATKSPVAATAFAIWCALFTSQAALAQDTTVFGNDNPNLAGRANGYACCGGDDVPDEAPELHDGFELHDCAKIRIGAGGKVSFSGGTPIGNNADGDDAYSMINHGDGISSPKNVRANALVGVFLDDESPTGETTPPQLDFADGLDFHRLEPGLRQIFFIGNGRTSDTRDGDYDGDPQAFIVPHGATRLYFGTVDGTGWYNNTGAFSLSVSITDYDPEVQCGDASLPKGITAGDALGVLRTAVASGICASCVCDVDRSGETVASDALRVLRYAVGQDVLLGCPCCPDLE
jgi:hypothetical protein